MSFNSEWEQRYSSKTHMSIWPWTDLVSLVHRYKDHKNRPHPKVLELGFGAGANIPLFIHLQMNYYGIEGSSTMVRQQRERFPQVAEQLYCGDFTMEQPFPTKFDFVVDRASLTHNSTKGIQRSLELVFHALEDGGLFFGIDWFSTNHSDFAEGIPSVDNHTREGYFKGQFSNLGQVHFSDRPHIEYLFRDFEIIHLQEKIHKQEIPKDNQKFASWNIVAEKRA